MKDIVLFGIQGSGKGTQSKILQRNFPGVFSYFSSGDLFRALLSTDNAVGNYLKERMERGDLINDEVTNSLFATYFYTVLHDKKTMLVDGYPRNMIQLEDIFRLAKNHQRELLGIQFVLPDEVAVERLMARGRADDNEAAIKHRINQFYELTVPMIDYFSENAQVIQIDANRPEAEIAEEVKSLLS